MSALPPAGWYDDPENPGLLRYWDGAMWTEHRSPSGATTSAGLSEIGTWLNTTFADIWSARVPLAALGALLLAVWAIAGAVGSWSVNDTAYVDGDWQNVHGGRLGLAALVLLLSALVSIVLYLAVIHQLHTARVGDAPSVPASLQAALRAAPRTIGWTLLLAVTASIGLGVLAVASVFLGPVAILLLLALLPVGVWLWIKLSFLLVACVAPVPGSNPVQASAAVSAQGRFWPVFGRLLLLAVIGAVITFVLGIPFSVASGAGPDIDEIVVLDGSDNVLFFHVGDFVDAIGFGGGALILLSSIPQMAGSVLTISGSTSLYAEVHGRRPA